MDRRTFLASSAAVVAGAVLPADPCVCDAPGLPDGLEVTFSGCPAPAAWNVFYGDVLVHSGPLDTMHGLIRNQSGIDIPSGAMLRFCCVPQSSAPAGE